MANEQRFRETVTRLPTEDEVKKRAAEGWTLAAVEWRRTTPEARETAAGETPYGLQTPDGRTRLRMDPKEEEALRLMLGMVVDDQHSLAAVAEELNRRGFRTRQGESWSQGEVFNMMPRLVEVAPRLFASSDWSAQVH